MVGVDGGDLVAGAILALLTALVATPAGVSGAVFLVPVQVSVLHVPNPALTPTNLLYNVVATPAAVLRFGRRAPLLAPLARVLLKGTVPGVIVGAVLRVEVLDGPKVFLLVVAALLLVLGATLLGGRGRPPREGTSTPTPGLALWGFGAGVVGGVYGIGGGSLLSPLLASLGYAMYAVAPATLAVTFVTSLVGAGCFQVLQLAHGDGTIAPEWLLGASMGLGGMAGGYLGARWQHRVPEEVLRRLLGGLCVLLAVRYGVQGA